jgi:hypothetical protein
MYVQLIFTTVKSYHVSHVIAIGAFGECIIAKLVRMIYPLNKYLSLFDDACAVQKLYNKFKSENRSSKC